MKGRATRARTVATTAAAGAAALALVLAACEPAPVSGAPRSTATAGETDVAATGLQRSESRPASPDIAARGADAEAVRPKGPPPPHPSSVLPTRPEAGRAPKLVLEKLFHEFGAVDEGTDHSAPFAFRNDGSGDLRILTAQHHCGCTDPYLEVDGKPYTWGDPIPPGGSGIAWVTLRTAGFSGEKPSQVDLYTNDPALGPTPVAPFGMTSLRIHATIQRLVELEEGPVVQLGSVSNVEPIRRTIHVRSTRASGLAITGFEPAEDPLVKVAAEPVDETRKRWKVSVEIPAGAPRGSFTKQFKILTEPAAPTTQFFVLGTIRGPIATEPISYLPFSVIPRGQAAARELVVRNEHPSIPMRISNLRLLDATDPRSLEGQESARPATVREDFDLRVEETEPGKAAKITVQAKATLPAGSFSMRLAFDTGVPGGPDVLSIPVAGFVR